MKKWVQQILLSLAIWSFNRFYNWIDSDKDGKLSQKELLAVSKKLQDLKNKLKQ